MSEVDKIPADDISDILKLIANPDEEIIKQYQNNFGELLSKIPENVNHEQMWNFIEIAVKIISEDNPSFEAEFERLLYLGNRKLSHRIMRDVTSMGTTSFEQLLIDSYHKVIQRDDTELAQAYFGDILAHPMAVEKLYSSLLSGGSPDHIQQIIDQCPFPPETILFYASGNNNSKVLETVFENLLNRNVAMNELCFYAVKGQTQFIRQINGEITEKMAGRIINDALHQNLDNFQALIDYFKEKGINVSTAIRIYRDGERRSAIDNACWIPKPEHLPILIANVNDEDLKVILSTENYAMRTPLGHCQYYNHSECTEIIIREMSRLQLTYDTGCRLRIRYVNI